jgi:hypothetical protein
MALSTAKHEDIHGATGEALAAIKASFDNGEHTGLLTYGPEAAIVYQIQKMQDEIDYLRTEISANKDKIGTTSTERSRIAANHAKTGITSSQASAITANTAKVSLEGSSSTALSFGALTGSVRGGFSIVMTAVKGSTTKSVTLTMT